MISEGDHKILSLFISTVRRRFPAAGIWVFGSRARGEGSEEPDLDVCVVVERFDDEVDKAIMEIAWKVGFEHDLVISTVTYSQDEFETGPCSESTLVYNILNEGVAA